MRARGGGGGGGPWWRSRRWRWLTVVKTGGGRASPTSLSSGSERRARSRYLKTCADHQRVVLPPPHLRGRREEADQRGVGRAWSGRAAHARQLLEHRLVVLLLDVQEDARREVVLDRLAVVLVQVLRPVVRRLLRAHRVHRRVQRRVLVGRDLLRVLAVAEVLEDLLDLEDAALPQLLPPLLQRDHRLRHRHALCAGSCLRAEGRGRVSGRGRRATGGRGGARGAAEGGGRAPSGERAAGARRASGV